MYKLAVLCFTLISLSKISVAESNCAQKGSVYEMLSCYALETTVNTFMGSIMPASATSSPLANNRGKLIFLNNLFFFCKILQ